MTDYVMIDRALIGKVSASLHDYKDGAEWGAFDLSALMELDDILAAPQQAAEPVAIAKTRREFHDYENSALEDDTGYLVTHVVWVKDPQDIGEIKLYAGHPPAQPEQPAPVPTSECPDCKGSGKRDYEYGSSAAWWVSGETQCDDCDGTGLTRPEAGQPTYETEIERVIARMDSSDPDFDDCADAVALIHRLAAEIKGPDGYATWRDAAIAERVRRVNAEWVGQNGLTRPAAPDSGDVL